MAPFVSSELDGDEYSASRAGCLTHGTYGLGGLDGPKSYAGPFGKEKNVTPHPGIDPPIVQRVV